MFKKAEERNYGVLMAAIVAIVAIVGMVVYFNGGVSGAAVTDYSTAGKAAYDNVLSSGEYAAGYDSLAPACHEECARLVPPDGITYCASYCKAADKSAQGY